MTDVALALTQRELIKDPAVIDELDRTYARLNGALRGMGWSPPDLEAGETVEVVGTEQRPMILTPKLVSLSSDITDLNPGDHNLIRVTPAGANRSIHGIQGGTSGRVLRLYVPASASYAVTFAHESASANADDRLSMVAAADLATVAGQVRGLELIYDATDRRWTHIGGSASLAAAGASGALDLDTTEVEVVNTASETAIYSFVVPANTLAAGKSLRFLVKGSHVKAGVAAGAFSAGVTFGGVTLATGNLSSGMGLSTDRRPLLVWGEIACVASGDQRAQTLVKFGNTGGDGAWLSLTANNISVKLLTLDLTAALTFEVLVTMSVADAANSVKKDLAVLEVMTE